MTVESIQTAIESLSAEELARFRAWFEQRDWQQWDDQIEADSAAGKLDFLVQEAKRVVSNDELQDL